mmetsp:Transcript_43583/g.76330  ORF Transcript_43583/g.76330 Transcript_43583/m.76330 type:complete len:83 (-) Transcript_43583:22-270(-)
MGKYAVSFSEGNRPSAAIKDRCGHPSECSQRIWMQTHALHQFTLAKDDTPQDQMRVHTLASLPTIMWLAVVESSFPFGAVLG